MHDQQNVKKNLYDDNIIKLHTLRHLFYYPFKDEAQTALFKDPGRTAL